MDRPPRNEIRLDPRACIRCASCSSLAPALFAVDARGSRLLRQPADEAEWRMAEVAAINCPTGAISTAPEGGGHDDDAKGR